jgi:hypothetical protein
MTDAQADRIEQKLDEVLKILYRLEIPISTLDELVVAADYVTKAKQLSKSTISKNDTVEKWRGIGQRKVLISLSSVHVLRHRKRRKTLKR